MTAPATARRPAGGAVAVGTGILISRLFGLVRQRVIAHFVGGGDAGDVLSTALKIPNMLQNLFGEGVLSASFVPVYARLRAEGRAEDAAVLARTVIALLAVLAAVLVLLGVALAPALVAIIAGGFSPDKQAFTVQLVRILFPGMGMLVLSAWCLGVLNAHRQFLLSYASPVAWNVAIIATLAVKGPGSDPAAAARLVAIGAVIGSVLQFAVQLPGVFRVLPAVKRARGTKTPALGQLTRNFTPVLLGRGVVQISAWVDQLIASYVTAGAAAALFYAQNIALLPVSVFGMSVSVSELTEMSHRTGADVEAAIRERLQAGLRAIAFFVVPSSAALFALGDVIAGAVLQTGRFGRDDTEWVWAVLAGSSVGLLAGTLGRLYNSAWYALHDTRTPVRFALIRILVAGALGSTGALLLPGWLGIAPRWGVAALTLSAGIAAWLEYSLLKRSLNARIGTTGLPAGFLPRVWGAAIIAAGVGFATKVLLEPLNPMLLAAAVFTTFGIAYFAAANAVGLPESHMTLRRILGRFGAGSGASR